MLSEIVTDYETGLASLSTTKRILFVDRADGLLGGLRDRLGNSRRNMELVFVTENDAALQELRNAPFDVIVSTIRLPGRNEVALLQKVKEEYPGIARIVLFGQTDQDVAFTALPVSHQFVTSPCTPEHLFNVIERTCRLRSLLSDESLRKTVGDIQKLPSLPILYHELMTAMARPNVSPQIIAGIIEQDPAMTAKVLQLVNSACFASSRHIARIDRAVVYLGMDLIKNLTLTAHVFGALNKVTRKSGISFEHQQRHAVVTAKVASRLLPDPQNSQYAFTAGLLHDIGNLILAVSVPDAFAAVQAAGKASGRPVYQLEFEMLGVTHAQVGAYLLGLWGLPYPIVEAVAYHHIPGAARERAFDVPAATFVADVLVDREMGIDVEMDLLHLDQLGVASKLPQWTQIAREEVELRRNRN